MRRFATQLIALLLAAIAFATTARAAVDLKIVTGPELSTAFDMGSDLAKFVAPAAGIHLEVVATAGSVEELPRLRTEPGVKFAIVQSDVFEAFFEQARAGDRGAASLVSRLRAVAPLHSEEIYLVVRADSRLKAIQEIRDSRINVGPIGSGSAVTAISLYRKLFGVPIPEGRASFLSVEDALVRLVDDKSIDVVVVVAGQPAKIFSRMRPGASRLVRLLRFDANDPASQNVIGSYRPTTIRASNYPNLLHRDMPALAVRSWLVTYDFDREPTIELLAAFARSLCANIGILRAQGHPKWRDVNLSGKDTGKPWSYYSPMTRELRSCAATTEPQPRTRTPTP